MTYTYSLTRTTTFTLTSARYIASKVVADLRRLKYYYGRPLESEIDDYYEELSMMLAHGFIRAIEYGFKRNGNRVVSLHYTVLFDGILLDGRAGGVYSRADITGANWFSYLWDSDNWSNLSLEQQNDFRNRLPIRRTFGSEPGSENGYWVQDRSYSYDGGGTQRQTFRLY